MLTALWSFTGFVLLSCLHKLGVMAPEGSLLDSATRCAPCVSWPDVRPSICKNQVVVITVCRHAILYAANSESLVWKDARRRANNRGKQMQAQGIVGWYQMPKSWELNSQIFGGKLSFRATRPTRHPSPMLFWVLYEYLNIRYQFTILKRDVQAKETISSNPFHPNIVEFGESQIPLHDDN